MKLKAEETALGNHKLPVADRNGGRWVAGGRTKEEWKNGWGETQARRKECTENIGVLKRPRWLL